MRLFVSVIFMLALTAIADESSELVQFENGKIADAEDINANFELLKDLIDEITEPSDNPTSGCAENDFVGGWIFSGPDFDSENVVELAAYDLYPNNFLIYTRYECSVKGCDLLGEITGSWGNFDSSSCSILVSASVESPSSAQGFVFLSASKSAITGFICDPTLGCKAGTLQKALVPDQAETSLRAIIKSIEVRTAE